MFNWFKKKEIRTIPSARELRGILNKKGKETLDVIREKIGNHFREGKHPYSTLTRDFYRSSCHIDKTYYSYDHEFIKKLIPELEALGYEVLYKIKTVQDFKNKEYEVNYCEVQIKDGL